MENLVKLLAFAKENKSILMDEKVLSNGRNDNEIKPKNDEYSLLQDLLQQMKPNWLSFVFILQL